MLRLYGVKVRVGILLLLSLLLPLPLGSQDAPSGTVSGEAGLPEGLSFQFKEGFLSVDIEEVPLDQVLRAIAEEAGIRLVFYGRPQEEISVTFTDVPLDRGLERVLKGRGFIFLYRGTGNRLEAIEVFSPKKAVGARIGIVRETRPVQRRQDANREFQELLGHPV